MKRTHIHTITWSDVGLSIFRHHYPNPGVYDAGIGIMQDQDGDV